MSSQEQPSYPIMNLLLWYILIYSSLGHHWLSLLVINSARQSIDKA